MSWVDSKRRLPRRFGSVLILRHVPVYSSLKDCALTSFETGMCGGRLATAFVSVMGDLETCAPAQQCVVGTMHCCMCF